MSKTLRIIGSACILLALGLFVGCSDDDSTPVIVEDPGPVAGSIGVYANAGGTDANIIDTGGLVMVYVVHHVENGATASQFSVEAPAGWTLQTEQAAFPVSIGGVTDGISVGYGSCMTGAILVTTLSYQTPGTSGGLMFKVNPHKDLPAAIQVVDCSQNLLEDGIGEETPVQ